MPGGARRLRREQRERYLGLPLRVHAFLGDVPLHDVWSVDLPGGGPERSVEDLRAIFAEERLRSVNPAVSALFRLRLALGRVFRWDDEPRSATRPSYAERLDADDRDRSRVAPGSSDGLFSVLYVFENEALGEVSNATVHAFSCMVLEPGAAGYTLYWAIYVQPVSRLTPFYMALIDPFRRWIIYPAILRHVRKAWIHAYG